MTREREREIKWCEFSNLSLIYQQPPHLTWHNCLLKKLIFLFSFFLCFSNTQHPLKSIPFSPHSFYLHSFFQSLSFHFLSQTKQSISNLGHYESIVFGLHLSFSHFCIFRPVVLYVSQSTVCFFYCFKIKLVSKYDWHLMHVT